jgi:hypothetical protein
VLLGKPVPDLAGWLPAGVPVLELAGLARYP